TAPQILPATPAVTLTATSIADPSKSAALAATITSRFAFSVSGPSSMNAGASANFAATLVPQPNSNPAAAISWSVSGTGCAGAAGSVDYVAPSAVPSLNPVTLRVISQDDPTKSAAANITILPHIVVSIFPPSVTLSPGARQGFSATVAGTTNQQVTWNLNGAG